MDDVKSSCPLHPGLHTYYNATDKGQQVREDKQPHKPWLSSDRRATRLREGGIAAIAGQHTAVNTFPGLVHTARHTMEVGHAEAVTQPQEDVEGGADDWGEANKVSVPEGADGSL